jgi:outer membrane protein
MFSLMKMGPRPMFDGNIKPLQVLKGERTMKRTVCLAVSVFILTLIPCTALALDENRFGIGGHVGYSSWNDQDFVDNNSTAVNIDFDNSFMFGANGTYLVNKYFSLELELDRITNISPVATPQGGAVLPMGDLAVTPLFFTGRVHYPLGYGLSPYVGAGAGYYWFSYDMNNGAFVPGDNVNWDSNWGFHLAAGVELGYPMGNNILALVFDFKYIWTETDLGLSGPTFGNAGVYGVDVKGFVAGVGLKYYF